jgi:D-3-phosphoglycerate dehydrogenase / 2-oxoglutarate reductase
VIQQDGLRRILYTDAREFPVAQHLLDRLLSAGFELVVAGGHDPEELALKGAECEGIFLYRARVDDRLLDAMPHCRVLARVGTGYELIDVQAAMRRNIAVTYVPKFGGAEMSDHVMMFVLAFARELPHLMWTSRSHAWQSITDMPRIRRLAGRKLGILGFGDSGARTAFKARAFGLDVLAWTRTPRPEAFEELGVTPTSWEQTLACDFVSVHLPLTKETRGLIGREALTHFKRGGVLINIARGGIVDTDALVDALREGRLGGAGLDVVEPYPLPKNHPLWDLPNVMITSHTASLSDEALNNSLSAAIEDAIAVLSGGVPANLVPELHLR